MKGFSRTLREGDPRIASARQAQRKARPNWSGSEALDVLGAMKWREYPIPVNAVMKGMVLKLGRQPWLIWLRG